MVGNHDGIGCRIECCGLHAKLFLGAFALGYFRLQGLVGFSQFGSALLDAHLQFCMGLAQIFFRLCASAEAVQQLGAPSSHAAQYR